jgi:hypothetical protein
MLINSQVSDLHQELIRRQWLALKNQESGLEDGYRERIVRYMRLGALTIQIAIASADITDRDFARVSAAAEKDPRLQFMQRMRVSAAMHGQFSQTLEESFYGSASSTSSVREASALIGMFMRVLDDLIDETPEIIAPERDRLTSILSKENMMRPEPIVVISDEELDAKHPAVSFLYKLTQASAAKIKQSEFWLGESSLSVREDFTGAIEAALLTEFDTMNCYMPVSSQDYNPNIRLPLRAKAENVDWVFGLIPATFLGWSELVNKYPYEVAIKKYGDLRAWMDDVQDLLADVGTGEANEVFLDLYENAGQPAFTTSDELYEKLPEWLSDERTVAQLVSKGLTLYKECLYGFETLGIANPVPVQQYITDVTLASIEPALLPDSPPPSTDNAVPAPDNPATPADNPTPPTDNAVPPTDNPAPLADNPTPAPDNPTPASDSPASPPDNIET